MEVISMLHGYSFQIRKQLLFLPQSVYVISHPGADHSFPTICQALFVPARDNFTH